MTRPNGTGALTVAGDGWVAPGLAHLIKPAACDALSSRPLRPAGG